ncbi:MAG: site-specific DNA-methyltransferase, partial [Pseudomonadota bacterium]|nr:site-specific DNA-methyltransferase [Pseudomonadota bacterium]
MKTENETLGLFVPRIATAFDQAEQIVLFQGDCLDGLRVIPSNSVKLIITSPPYNLNKVYEKRSNLEQYLRSIDPVLDELVRVLAADGSICWQVGNYVESGEVFPLDIYYYPRFVQRNLRLRNRIIWHFEHGLHASNRLSGRYETLLW